MFHYCKSTFLQYYYMEFKIILEYNKEILTSNNNNNSDYMVRVEVMVFNATFNYISAVSWRSVFCCCVFVVCCWRKLVYREKSTDLPQVTYKLYHIILYHVHLAMSGIELISFCIGRSIYK